MINKQSSLASAGRALAGTTRRSGPGGLVRNVPVLHAVHGAGGLDLEVYAGYGMRVVDVFAAALRDVCNIRGCSGARVLLYRQRRSLAGIVEATDRLREEPELSPYGVGYGDVAALVERQVLHRHRDVGCGDRVAAG